MKNLAMTTAELANGNRVDIGAITSGTFGKFTYIVYDSPETAEKVCKGKKEYNSDEAEVFSTTVDNEDVLFEKDIRGLQARDDSCRIVAMSEDGHLFFIKNYDDEYVGFEPMLYYSSGNNFCIEIITKIEINGKEIEGGEIEDMEILKSHMIGSQARHYLPRY